MSFSNGNLAQMGSIYSSFSVLLFSGYNSKEGVPSHQRQSYPIAGVFRIYEPACVGLALGSLLATKVGRPEQGCRVLLCASTVIRSFCTLSTESFTLDIMQYETPRLTSKLHGHFARYVVRIRFPIFQRNPCGICWPCLRWPCCLRMSRPVPLHVLSGFALFFLVDSLRAAGFRSGFVSSARRSSSRMRCTAKRQRDESCAGPCAAEGRSWGADRPLVHWARQWRDGVRSWQDDRCIRGWWGARSKIRSQCPDSAGVRSVTRRCTLWKVDISFPHRFALQRDTSASFVSSEDPCGSRW